jgi:Ca2+-binding RTX toxin-like protein
MLEALESRRLLSVTLADGILTVTGTDQNDTLFVGRNQTMIVVNDNGTASQYPPADVNSIVILGLEGHDRIGIGPGLHKPITADGGEGNDYITGGTGPERLMGGPGNDKLVGGGGGDLLEGGAGDDMLEGGPGNDRMFGGPGNDRFLAVDGYGDLLNGGEGEDMARIDRGDHAHFIEHISVGPRPEPTGALADSADSSKEDDDGGLLEQIA